MGYRPPPLNIFPGDKKNQGFFLFFRQKTLRSLNIVESDFGNWLHLGMDGDSVTTYEMDICECLLGSLLSDKLIKQEPIHFFLPSRDD